ncbi:MAG: type 12 methyltransferase [Gemmataceae bacterium]|nr:type 12 methyltransferase [Gemmataceae bacterium]
MPALNLSSLDAPVDTTIAETDGMLVRHAPPDQAWNHYFACGLSALRAVRLALVAAGTAVVHRVLDLPCGYGRVLRVLRAAYPAAELHACDLERGGVDFCAARFGAEPIYSDPDPRNIRLPGGYDLIWVGSLLTHLSAARWPAFLALFRASLAPGGVCVFTVHGHHAAGLIRSEVTGYGLHNPAGLLRSYQRTGFAYAAYPGQDYGISLSSPGWVCGQLAAVPAARLVTYVERGWSDHQDVVAFAADPAPGA